MLLISILGLLGLPNRLGQATYAWLRMGGYGPGHFVEKLGGKFAWGTYLLTEWWWEYLERQLWKDDLTIRFSLRLAKPYEWLWLENLKRAFFERLNSGTFGDANKVGIRNAWSFPTRDPLGNDGKLVICPMGAEVGRTFTGALANEHVLRQEWQHLANVVHVKVHRLARRVPGVDALWVDHVGEIQLDPGCLAAEPLIRTDNVIPLPI